MEPTPPAIGQNTTAIKKGAALKLERNTTAERAGEQPLSFSQNYAQLITPTNPQR